MKFINCKRIVDQRFSIMKPEVSDLLYVYQILCFMNKVDINHTTNIDINIDVLNDPLELVKSLTSSSYNDLTCIETKTSRSRYDCYLYKMREDKTKQLYELYIDKERLSELYNNIYEYQQIASARISHAIQYMIREKLKSDIFPELTLSDLINTSSNKPNKIFLHSKYIKTLIPESAIIDDKRVNRDELLKWFDITVYQSYFKHGSDVNHIANVKLTHQAVIYINCIMQNDSTLPEKLKEIFQRRGLLLPKRPYSEKEVAKKVIYFSISESAAFLDTKEITNNKIDNQADTIYTSHLEFITDSRLDDYLKFAVNENGNNPIVNGKIKFIQEKK